MRRCGLSGRAQHGPRRCLTSGHSCRCTSSLRSICTHSKLQTYMLLTRAGKVSYPDVHDPFGPQMAACHAELGDYASAIAVLEAVAEAQPRQPGVLMQLANMYTRCL